MAMMRCWRFCRIPVSLLCFGCHIRSDFMPKEWMDELMIPMPDGKAKVFGPPTVRERPSTPRVAREPPAKFCIFSFDRTRWRTDSNDAMLYRPVYSLKAGDFTPSL